MSDFIEDLQEFVDLLKAVRDRPKKVIELTNIALLIDNNNWDANNDYSGSSIIGQHAGDWYKDDYYFYFFDTDIAPIRILKNSSNIPFNVLINQ